MKRRGGSDRPASVVSPPATRRGAANAQFDVMKPNRASRPAVRLLRLVAPAAEWFNRSVIHASSARGDGAMSIRTIGVITACLGFCVSSAFAQEQNGEVSTVEDWAVTVIDLDYANAE